MPPVDPEAKIPCPTPGHLHAELERLTDVLTPPETEDSWEKMEKAIIRFSGITRGGGYKHVDVYVSGVGRTGIGSRLVDCMLSDRGRLSGAATDLLTALAPRLGHHFGPLIPLYLPPVVRLLARPNKIFLKRADKCLSTIITHCPLGTMLPYIGEGTVDKSEACRRASSTGLARACEEWTKDVWGSRGVIELENCLRKVAVDKDAEVRKIGKKIWSLYNTIWPERVDDFSAPLTPTIRRYLDISAAAGGSSKPRMPTKARPAPPTLLSSSASSSSAAASKTIAPQRAQPTARPFVAAPPARPSRAETKMPAEAYIEPEQLQRTTVHREKLDAELARPLLSRAPASLAPLQGPVRPDVSKHGRSHSAAILSTGAMREAVDLPRPVKLPLAAGPSTYAMQPEASGPRRFAPPARIVKPHYEDPDGDAAESTSGPLRGPARAMPMGETRRQLMGQAHRRAHPGPGPSLNAPITRVRPEIDLAEIAVRAAMLPLPDSPPRQMLVSVALPEEEHPASPSPVRAPLPSLTASVSAVAEPAASLSLEQTSPSPVLTEAGEVKQPEDKFQAGEAPEPATQPVLNIFAPTTDATELNESIQHVDINEVAAAIEDVVESPAQETAGETRVVQSPAPAAHDPQLSLERQAPPTARIEPPAEALAVERNAIGATITTGQRAAFKPRVAGRAPASGSRQPFKPTPSPSVVAAASTKRSATATRAVSASSAAGPSRPTADSTSRASPSKSTASSRPAAANGRTVSASAARSRPTTASSSRSTSPSRATATSGRTASTHVPKPPIPPNRREAAKPTVPAASALKKSASSKPVMAPPPVPAARKERVRLKAPLPSFVPRKPAAAAGAKARPEAVPLPSSPAKAKEATKIPLPASPAHAEAVATPLPPSPERPASQQSLRATRPTQQPVSRPASQASSIAPSLASPAAASLRSSVTASAVSSTSQPASEHGAHDAEADETVGVTFHSNRAAEQLFDIETDSISRPEPREGDLLHLAVEEPRFNKANVPMTPGRALAIKLGFLDGPATPGTPVVRQALGDKDPNIVETETALLF